MNFKYLFIFYVVFSLWTTSFSLLAQPAEESFEELSTIPSKQFNDWLTTQSKSVEVLDDSLILAVISKRLATQQGISDNVLVRFLEEKYAPSYGKILLINKRMSYPIENVALKIDLLRIKSYYLTIDSIPNDSIILDTYLDLNTYTEKESLRLLKIQYENYLNLGEMYQRTYQNNAKAELYFDKIRRYPFYMHEEVDDLLFFKNLYVRASIGQIKCRAGNYPALNELNFVPAAFPEILLTYKIYIEDAGGKCALCDKYLNFKN